MGSKLLIIIPAFNEALVIKQTIQGITNAIGTSATLLVVDDGSSDQTYRYAKLAGAHVIRHLINRGLGGALGTGLHWAKSKDIQYAITVDADGQHDPLDIRRVLSPLVTNKADIVIGTRMKLGWKEIPFDRRILILMSNILTWWIFGIRTSDSLSGLRGFNRKAIEKIQIRTDQMEVSNEFFWEVKKHHLRLVETPIRVIYTEYSRSKGQKNSNAFDVVVKLLIRLFR